MVFNQCQQPVDSNLGSLVNCCTNRVTPYFDFEKFSGDFVSEVIDEDLGVVEVVPQPGREDVDEGQLWSII